MSEITFTITHEGSPGSQGIYCCFCVYFRCSLERNARIEIRVWGPLIHNNQLFETSALSSCQAPLRGALGPQRKQLGPSAGADRLQLSCQGSSQPDLPSGKLKSPGYGPTVTLQCHRSNFSCLLQPRQPQEQPTSRTTSAKDLNRLDRQVSPTQIRRKPRSEGRKPAGLPL